MEMTELQTVLISNHHVPPLHVHVLEHLHQQHVLDTLIPLVPLKHISSTYKYLKAEQFNQK